jgi:hypothetical protein
VSCRVHLRNNGGVPCVTVGPCPDCSVVMLSLAISHCTHLFHKPQGLRLFHNEVVSGRACLFYDVVGICTVYLRMGRISNEMVAVFSKCYLP